MLLFKEKKREICEAMGVSMNPKGDPFTVYTDTRSSPCTLQTSYYCVCQLHLNKAFVKKRLRLGEVEGLVGVTQPMSDCKVHA